MPPDDLLDAAAASWSAWRFFRSRAHRLPLAVVGVVFTLELLDMPISVVVLLGAIVLASLLLLTRKVRAAEVGHDPRLQGIDLRGRILTFNVLVVDDKGTPVAGADLLVVDPRLKADSLDVKPDGPSEVGLDEAGNVLYARIAAADG